MAKKRLLKVPQNTVKGTKRQLKVHANTVKGKKRQLKVHANTVRGKKRQLKVPEKTVKGTKRQLKDPEVPPIKKLKTGHNDNLSKAATKSLNIESFYSNFITDVRKIQEKLETFLSKRVKQAARNKSKKFNEDLKKMESVTMAHACNILVEQINKISSNFEEMQDTSENEKLFISIEKAESQLKSFEDRLNQLDMNKTMQQYKSEAIKKLNSRLDKLKASVNTSISDSTSISSASMLETPVFIKALNQCSIRACFILPNQQLLVINSFNEIKLIDTKQGTGTIVSELKLPYLAWDITQTKPDEFAIACHNHAKIQFVSLSSDKLYLGRDVPCVGRSFGIAYNDEQDNLIVTNPAQPPRVEIRSLTGRVLKRLENDATGNRLFQSPDYVAISPDKTMIYVTDSVGNSVTLMTLNGQVKAVYKDEWLLFPKGVCVNRFGIVYVVGYRSHTVHQIVPGSDKLELLLDENDGLRNPITISYCDVEDILYVGQDGFNCLHIFKMRGTIECD